jgi:predicted transcriptional regulator
LVLVCCSGSCERCQCIELTERESSVCSVICDSRQPVSFSELKRSTDFHQEILSRIIRRLMVHGVVKKLESGRYRRARTRN